MQPSGDRVRVNAQLIDAGNGAQFTEVEAARVKRTPAANPTAEDLALRCVAAVNQGGYVGKEAQAGYGLCEQALALDPDNAQALTYLSVKFLVSGDGKQADAMASKALSLDPNYAIALRTPGTRASQRSNRRRRTRARPEPSVAARLSEHGRHIQDPRTLRRKPKILR